MHSIRNKVLSIVVIAAVLVAVIITAHLGIPIHNTVETSAEEEGDKIVYDKETVYLWYTDDVLTNFLNAAAVEYNEEHGTRIVPVLMSGLNYLEAINSSSIESNVPDLYIISNDALGKGYLAGLVDGVISMDDGDNGSSFSDNYLRTASNATTYKDSVIAYPLYFETTAMLYNKTYFDEIPDAHLPETMSDMTQMANEYDAPENVETFFKWDVSDIFYNYFFIGDAIDVGGLGGYDTEKLDVYNENAIRSLEAYQSLNQFFSIDTKTTEYDDVINDFIDGKIVFTIATTDVVQKLEDAKADGTFKYEYAVTLIPDMTEELQTRSLSTTTCVAVNPFSTHRSVAHNFAAFLTTEYADTLYQRTGKLSAAKNVEYENDALNAFVKEYDYSVPLPKMVETGNLWMLLEAAFSGIWDGDDVNDTLRALAEQMTYQVTGVKEEIPKIELTYEVEETEYFDEEEMRQAALAEDDPEEGQ